MGDYTPVLLTAADKIGTNTAFLSDSGLSNARDADVQAWDALLTQCANIQVQIGWQDPPFNTIPDYDYPNQPVITSLRTWIGQILASNNSKFGLHMQAAFAHRKQLNAAINSTANGNTIAASSFTSMNELSTGNISLVSTDPAAFGQDLINTGRLLNFANVANYGTVDALFKILAGTNMLETLRPEFAATGTDIDALVSQVATAGQLPLTSQKIVYEVSKTITGRKLTDILLVLSIETQGINTLADLVNTSKLFPHSKDTLRSLNNGAPTNIYSTNGVSSWVSQLSTTQASVMPAEIAQANKAFGMALQQIKNIYDLDAVTLGEQALTIELNTGLTSIENQTSPLDPGVQASLTSTFAGGTGTNGEYTIEDVFGAIISSDVYENAVNGLIASPGNATDVAVINNRIAADKAFFAEIGIWNGTSFVTTATRTTALNIALQLSTWAEDEEISQFILQIIKTGSGGDAIDAALREARNQSKLRSAGIGSDLQINDLPQA